MGGLLQAVFRGATPPGRCRSPRHLGRGSALGKQLAPLSFINIKVGLK